MYAYIEHNEIIKIDKLPKTWQFEDGRTISGFHLLDSQIHKSEGWLTIEEIKPEYDAETQYLTNPHYEILEDKVIKTWQVEQIVIEPQEPSELEELTNYVLDVDFRVIMLEMGL